MAQILPTGRQLYLNNAGLPAVGGRLFTYRAGTTIPKDTWSNAAGTALNSNPIILDARGEASVFWDGAYNVALYDVGSNLLWTQDDITTAANAFASGSTGSAFIPAGTTAQRDATPSAGWTRFNTTTKSLETYSTTGWAGSASVLGSLNQSTAFFTTAGTAAGVPEVLALVAGFRLNLKFHVFNAGPSTLIVNGLPAAPLKRFGINGAIIDPQISTGMITDVVFDGVNFMVLEPLPITGASVADVTNEATLRANADTTLQNNIVNEANSRQSADITLQNAITNNTNAIAVLSAPTVLSGGGATSNISGTFLTSVQVPAGRSGVYLLAAGCQLSVNANSLAAIQVKKNGNTITEFLQIGAGGGSPAQTHSSAAAIFDSLVAGDIITTYLAVLAGSATGTVTQFYAVQQS
jgi:hypothetical protein